MIMEKIAQRFHQNDGEHRTRNRQTKKKSPATPQQALQPRVIAAGVEMRDVVGYGKSGRGRQQPQQRHQPAQRAVGAAKLADSLQVMSHDALKSQVAKTGHKTDGGENDAAGEQPGGRAGIAFQLLAHTSGCNSFS